MVSGGWLVEEVELLVFGGSFASRGRQFGRWCRLMGRRCWCGDCGSRKRRGLGESWGCYNGAGV